MFEDFLLSKRHNSVSAQKKHQNDFEEDRIALLNDLNKLCEDIRVAYDEFKFNKFKEEYEKGLK